MKRIEARIKTPFGEVVIEGENPQEILDMLGLYLKVSLRNYPILSQTS